MGSGGEKEGEKGEDRKVLAPSLLFPRSGLPKLNGGKPNASLARVTRRERAGKKKNERRQERERERELAGVLRIRVIDSVMSRDHP